MCELGELVFERDAWRAVGCYWRRCSEKGQKNIRADMVGVAKTEEEIVRRMMGWSEEAGESRGSGSWC